MAGVGTARHAQLLRQAHALRNLADEFDPSFDAVVAGWPAYARGLHVVAVTGAPQARMAGRAGA